MTRVLLKKVILVIEFRKREDKLFVTVFFGGGGIFYFTKSLFSCDSQRANIEISNILQALMTDFKDDQKK